MSTSTRAATRSQKTLNDTEHSAASSAGSNVVLKAHTKRHKISGASLNLTEQGRDKRESGDVLYNDDVMSAKSSTSTTTKLNAWMSASNAFLPDHTRSKSKAPMITVTKRATSSTIDLVSQVTGTSVSSLASVRNDMSMPETGDNLVKSRLPNNQSVLAAKVAEILLPQIKQLVLESEKRILDHMSALVNPAHQELPVIKGSSMTRTSNGEALLSYELLTYQVLKEKIGGTVWDFFFTTPFAAGKDFTAFVINKSMLSPYGIDSNEHMLQIPSEARNSIDKNIGRVFSNLKSSITSDVKENFPTQVFFSKLVLGSEGREDPVIRNVQVSMGKKDYKQLDEFRQAYAHIAGVFDPDVDEISRDVKKGSEAFKISPRIIFGVEQLNDKSSVLKWESLVALIFKRVSEKYHKHQNAKQWDDLDEDKRNGFEAFLWLCIWHYFQGNPMVTSSTGNRYWVKLVSSIIPADKRCGQALLKARQSQS